MDALYKRKTEVKIEIEKDQIDSQMIEEKLREAMEQQNEMIIKGVEIQEKELLDYYEVEVGDQTLGDKALKKKIIERAKKEQ